jgi:Mor family transcriptional regulator
MPDLLCQLLREVADVLQQRGIEFRPQEQSAVESALRRAVGGDRVYIGKTSVDAIREVSNRDRAILRDWQRGDHVPVLARRYGISTRRVQQLLKIETRETVCLNDFARGAESVDNEPVREPAAQPVRRRHARPDV